MKPDKHFNRIEYLCSILGTECDNPGGCIGCYHQEVEDYRAFYAGEGPIPNVVVKKRLEEHADR